MEHFGKLEVAPAEEKLPIKPIYTEVVLTKEKNRGSDCGPLSVEMVLRSDIPELKGISLQDIEVEMHKESTSPALPGDLCRVLKEYGYDVTYHTGVDWKKIADIEQTPQEWGEKIATLFNQNPMLLERIGEEKFRSSAEWMSNTITLTKEATLSEMADMLEKGARVIVSVRGGRHFVVLTGIDEKNVYFNNPDAEPTRDMMNCEDFEKFWSKEVIEASLVTNVGK